jgi:hypothetical protein
MVDMERRINERKEFRKPLDIRLSDPCLGTLTCEAYAFDISSSGLGMVSNYSAKPGSVLQIRIPVDDRGIALPIFAEVAWVSAAGKGFRTGLVYLGT